MEEKEHKQQEENEREHDNSKRIEVSISVEPKAYSFTSPAASPKFTITTTYRPMPTPTSTRTNDSITILAVNNILDPQLGLKSLFFKLTDLSTKPPREFYFQGVRVNRAPLQRVHKSGDEKYFLTLTPNEPTPVTVDFYPTHLEHAPLPWGDERRIVYNRGEHVQRSVFGIDGLEPGHRYRMEVVGGLEVRWWRWGIKEDVLEPEGSWATIDKPDGQPIAMFAGGDSGRCEFEVVA